MKVLALSRYTRTGPSSRLRFYQFAPYLASAGLELEILPLLGEKYLQGLFKNGRRSAVEFLVGAVRRCRRLLDRDFDLLWIEKELFPWIPSIDEILMRSCRTPIVVDYDDAVFHLYDRHRNTGVRLLLGRKIDRIMRYAGMVVAGNPYLADRARDAGAGRIEIVPTSVDTDRYQHRDNNRSGFTVGWIGTPVTEMFLSAIRWPLHRLQEAHGDTAIVLVGASASALPALQRKIVPWSEASEVGSIQGFDVGIMPLFDSPFERGKCGYKLIQCMACGVPVVASPVGVNRDIIDHGENGFLADTESEWLHYLRLLKDDEPLRQRLGRQARIKVENHYALSQVGPRVARLLGQVRSR